MKTAAQLYEILKDGNHSLAIATDTARTFDGRGIADLYNILTRHPECLRGASVADKIVGKGAVHLWSPGRLMGGCKLPEKQLSGSCFGLFRIILNKKFSTFFMHWQCPFMP